MRGIVLLAGFVSLWTHSAAAIDRISLDGYHDFKFGMPEADLRARVKVTKEEPGKGYDVGTFLSSAETVQIDGDTYELGFWIENGLLSRVHLMRSLAGTPSRCEREFANTNALLQSMYGPPDQPPDPLTFKDKFVASVEFTFNDGGSIFITSVGGAGDCDVRVLYSWAQG